MYVNESVCERVCVCVLSHVALYVLERFDFALHQPAAVPPAPLVPTVHAPDEIWIEMPSKSKTSLKHKTINSKI